MIIEFNGLPGTGKTTVVKCLKQMLDEAHISNEMYGILPMPPINENIPALLSGGLKLFFKTLRFCKKGVNGIEKENKRVARVPLLYYCYYTQYEKNKFPQVLLCDQGIMQGLISVAHTDPIINQAYLESVIQAVKEKKFDIIYVNCKNDAKLSKERLSLRQNGGSRFDKMNDSEREAGLKIQESNFEVLRASMMKYIASERIINMDTSLNPQENAKIIFNMIIGE